MFTEPVASVRESLGYSLTYVTGSVRYGLRTLRVLYTKDSVNSSRQHSKFAF